MLVNSTLLLLQASQPKSKIPCCVRHPCRGNSYASIALQSPRRYSAQLAPSTNTRLLNDKTFLQGWRSACRGQAEPQNSTPSSSESAAPWENPESDQQALPLPRHLSSETGMLRKCVHPIRGWPRFRFFCVRTHCQCVSICAPIFALSGFLDPAALKLSTGGFGSSVSGLLIRRYTKAAGGNGGS
jgi:hypothetical protein